MRALENAGRAALAAHGERTHCYTHLSHVYAQGSSVYSTFVYRIGSDYDTALARWQALKTAVGDAIVSCGGTITHQHGIGKDHVRWLPAEKGATGMIDNTLWGGDVARPARDDDTRALQALNDKLKDDERVDLCLLPFSDGVTLARKR